MAGGAVPAFDAAQEIVVAAFSNGEIQAFNARIGYPLWSNNLINVQQIGASVSINAVKASPVIDKNTVFAVGNNGLTMAINLENGDVLWQKTIGGTSTPVVDDQALFVLSNNFELLALEKETGEIMWAEPLFNDMSSKERLKLYVRGPVMINSELLITASNGTVLTFDARTGKQKTTLRLGDDLPFEPIAADGSVIFTTNEAKLIVYQ